MVSNFGYAACCKVGSVNIINGLNVIFSFEFFSLIKMVGWINNNILRKIKEHIFPIYYQIYQILLFYQFAILYFYKLMYNEIDF